MPKKNSGPRLVWRPERDEWEIQWTERRQRRRKSTGTSCSENAKRQLADFLLGVQTPQQSADPSQRLIGHILADYACEHARNTHSAMTIGFNIEALEPFWGGLTALDIKRANCQRYVSFRRELFAAKEIARLRRKGMSPEEAVHHARQLSLGTIRRELETLRAAVNHDFAEERIKIQPHVWLPERPAVREKWITGRQAAALLREARKEPKTAEHLPLFILIALYTGARKGAILQLRWPQVDLERRLINFNPPGRAQTTKRRAVTPIPKRLLRELKAARKRGTDLGYVVHIGQKKIKDVKHGLANAGQRAGIANLTPHVLRHTTATWLSQKGVRHEQLSQYLGHADSSTTERVYIHHHPEYLREVAAAFG